MHQLHLRVYLEDTDAQGIVYYGNFLKYMERARTEWLRSLGFELGGHCTRETTLVVRRVVIDFVRPARLDDELRVQTDVRERTRTSVELQQGVFRQHELLCNSLVSVVSVLSRTLRPTRLPTELADHQCSLALRESCSNPVTA